MGLLDDAIREHLELKRRHGANPDEVARQESEALGPSRRGEFAQAEGTRVEPASDEPVADVPLADVPVADVPAADVPLADEPLPDAPLSDEPFEDAPLRDEPLAGEPLEDEFTADGAIAGEEPVPGDPDVIEAPAAADPAPGYDEDPWLPDDLDEVPRSETLEHPAPAAPGEPEAGDEAEDVLEETPDFLQETPEHDRLWFEQKPPRNFDWDK